MKAKKDIKEFVKEVSKLEDAEHPYKPEYLGMRSENREAERICDECEEECHRESYCEEVYDYLERKQKLLSCGNRIIDVLLKHGVSALPEYFSKEEKSINALSGEVELDWDSKECQKLCESCRLYGKEECPEEVYAESCARKVTVQAVEQVVEAVNYLLS